MAEIRLLPHATLGGLEKALREQVNRGQDAINDLDGRHPRDGLGVYLDWVYRATRDLGNHLRRPHVEELLHTGHYWTLRQMNGSEGGLPAQIAVEIYARRDAMNVLAEEALAIKERWDVPGVIVVPDTNKLVETDALFDKINWPDELGIGNSVHLVVPMVVVGQLDVLKKHQRTRSQVRQTIKRIKALLPEPLERTIIRPADDQGRQTTLEVLVDPLDHHALADPDSEIVDRAVYLRDLTHRPVCVATWDGLMIFKCGLEDLETVHLPDSREKQN